jgi:hypothetical protein
VVVLTVEVDEVLTSVDVVDADAGVDVVVFGEEDKDKGEDVCFVSDDDDDDIVALTFLVGVAVSGIVAGSAADDKSVVSFFDDDDNVAVAMIVDDMEGILLLGEDEEFVGDFGFVVDDIDLVTIGCGSNVEESMGGIVEGDAATRVR